MRSWCHSVSVSCIIQYIAFQSAFQSFSFTKFSPPVTFSFSAEISTWTPSTCPLLGSKMLKGWNVTGLLGRQECSRILFTQLLTLSLLFKYLLSLLLGIHRVPEVLRKIRYPPQPLSFPLTHPLTHCSHLQFYIISHWLPLSFDLPFGDIIHHSCLITDRGSQIPLPLHTASLNVHPIA